MGTKRGRICATRARDISLKCVLSLGADDLDDLSFDDMDAVAVSV